MSVAIHAFSNKLTAVLMANKEASTAAGAWDKVVKDLGSPLNVYSDDGTKFKKESKHKIRSLAKVMPRWPSGLSEPYRKL